MIKLLISFFLSILIHVLFIYNIYNKVLIKEEKISQNKMKIKLIKKKEVKKNKSVLKRNYYSLLQSDSSAFSSNKYLVDKNGDIPLQRQLTISSLLNNYINYPEVLGRNEIQGGVTVHFILSKDGTYLEKLTKIDSKSRYLRVYVAKSLRKAFSEVNLSSLKLTKTTKIKLLVLFHLTQENIPYLKSGIYDDYIFLYRKQDGISTISDRVNFTIKKAFGYISNILTLINDLVPDSSQTKVKRIYELQSYENDPFW